MLTAEPDGPVKAIENPDMLTEVNPVIEGAAAVVVPEN